MGFAFRLMIFMVLLNVAVGMLQYVSLGQWVVQGMPYDPDRYSSNLQLLEASMNQTTTAPIENAATFGSNLLNFLSLGLFMKIKVFLQATLYAVPVMFFNLGLISSQMETLLTWILTLSYLLGMFEIVTWRDLSNK